MASVIEVLPSLEGQELVYVQGLIENMSKEDAHRFAQAYGARRRDPTLILLTALVGLLGFAGVHRFLLDQPGMGVLYFFTAGICFIGTILDVVNHKRLTFEFNQPIAYQLVQTMGKSG